MSARKQPKPSNIVEYKTYPRLSLTAKQAKYAEQYVLLGDKTKAALAAGYGAKTASWQANKNNTLQPVQEYIKYLLQTQESDLYASLPETRRRLAEAIRGNLEEEVVMMATTTTKKKDKHGRPVIITKTEPVVAKKKISLRDSLKAAELAWVAMGDMKVDIEQETAKSKTDEALLKALNEHKVLNMPDPAKITYEEDAPDGDEASQPA